MTNDFEPIYIEAGGWDSGRFFDGFYLPNLHRGVARPKLTKLHALHHGERPLVRALDALGAVGIPVPEASEALERSRSLRKQSRVPVETTNTADLESRLASGKLSPAKYQERLQSAVATLPDVDPRPGFRSAADSALAEAHLALARIGDDFISGPLATLCDQLLDDGTDEDGWVALWNAVDSLRSRCAFASSVLFAPRVCELYRRPHAARSWQLEEANRRDRHAVRAVRSSGRLIWRSAPRHALPPATSLAVASERREEWGAALLSAEQIDANITAILRAEAAMAS